ncbi:MAG TPA: flavodoxin-dependent (E)-4-hydroxy-3-methylbut-2-enyl-diphosphate synthase, partial [Opitutales bacterium]|nr:flavodoxin-dependent (E)-4-hydroxy-3-methylbut-2-enyl-diphosphate synthase [Opitutales bacterium]
VFAKIQTEEWQKPEFPTRLRFARMELRDNPLEGILLTISSREELQRAISEMAILGGLIEAVAFELKEPIDLKTIELPDVPFSWIFVRKFGKSDATALSDFADFVNRTGAIAALDIAPEDFPALRNEIAKIDRTIFCLSEPSPGCHTIGTYRALVGILKKHGIAAPIWLRNTETTVMQKRPEFLSLLLEASIHLGSLLSDGIGDLISIETETDPVRSTRLAYNVLQGSGARISKTEFVACPSCGRTLFDLQSTTQRIREKTGHLKGLKIAIMGCIVNGPGEMADADFGYVGGAPGRVNLYVGKECVEYHVPAAEADQRLIDLIKDHGKWTDPEEETAAQTSETN